MSIVKKPVVALGAALAVAVATFVVGTGLLSPATAGTAHANRTPSTGDRATARIAHRLNATRRGDLFWIDDAVSLPRAERIKTRHHGAFAILHVRNHAAARREHKVQVRDGDWFVQKGRQFVMPVAAWNRTAEGTGARFHHRATWARRHLGLGWRVFK